MSKPFGVTYIPACDEECGICSVIVEVRGCVDWGLVCDDGVGDMTGEIVGAEAVKLGYERNMGYSVYDINDSVLTIGVGKCNV
jgi:hypothetical protein